MGAPGKYFNYHQQRDDHLIILIIVTVPWLNKLFSNTTFPLLSPFYCNTLCIIYCWCVFWVCHRSNTRLCSIIDSLSNVNSSHSILWLVTPSIQVGQYCLFLIIHVRNNDVVSNTFRQESYPNTGTNRTTLGDLHICFVICVTNKPIFPTLFYVQQHCLVQLLMYTSPL